MSLALAAGGVLAGLAMAPLLAMVGAATFIMLIPVAVGIAVLIAAIRNPVLQSPALVAAVTAGITAVVLYVALLAYALSAVPEDFQDVM